MPQQPVELHSNSNTVLGVGGILGTLEDIHSLVCKNNGKTNDMYNVEKEKSRRTLKFEEEEFVMVHLKKDRFPIGCYSK